MDIQSIMSATSITTSPDTTVRELWKILFAKRVNAIPVVDAKKKLLGIITKEDLLKALYPDYQEYFVDLGEIEDFEAMELKVRELGSKKAKDIMCKRVVYTRTDTPIMRALSRMIARRLNQLPVLSETDMVVGMVTKGDVFYALFRKNLAENKADLKQTTKSRKSLTKRKK